MNDYEPAQYNLHYESGDNQSGYTGEQLAQPLVVRVADQSGNGIAAVDVTFSAENGGQVIEAQPVPTDADGVAHAHYILGSTPGQYEVMATSGLTEDSKVVFHARATEYDILIFKNYGDGQTGIVGRNLSSPLVVRASYDNGEPAGGIDITFFVEPDNGAIQGDSLFIAPTDETGKARAVWTLGESAGTQFLVARHKNETLQFAATALADDAVKIVADPLEDQDYNAGKSYPVSCYLYDQFENATPNQNVNFSVLSGSGSLAGTTDQSVQTDESGHAKIVWTLGLNHTVQNKLTASIDSDSVFWIIENIYPPLLSRSSISARDSMVADGVDSTHITIHLLNEAHQPLPDYPVSIHVSGSENVVQPISAKSDVNGACHAIFKSTFPEIKYITAEVPGVGALPDTLALECVKPQPRGVHLVKLGGDHQTVVAGHQPQEPLTLRVVDQDNIPVPDKAMLFRLSNRQADFRGSDSVIVHSDAQGKVSAALHVNPVIEHNPVVAAASIAEDSTVHTFTLYLIPDTPSSMSRLTPDSVVVTPHDSLQLAVRLRDPFGNDTPDMSVTFSSDADDLFYPDSSKITDSLGIARTTLIAGAPSAWHHITIFSDSLFSRFDFRVKLIEHLEKSDQDTIILKYKNESALLQLKCLDAFDQPLANFPVRFRLVEGQGEFEEPAETLSDKNGVAQIFWRPHAQSPLSILQAATRRDSVFFYVKQDVESFVNTNRRPEKFALGDNYPNPCNPTTTIPFSVPQLSRVTIVLYNIQGQKIRTLIDDQCRPGHHVIVFDMKDEGGRAVPSGVYFYKMSAENFLAKKRLLLLK